MAWGKEEFRTKYKESNDCLKKIKDNYYDLDYEYQMIAKELQQKENIIKEVREYIEMHTPSDIGICGNSTKIYYTLGEDSVDHILEILDKGE